MAADTATLAHVRENRLAEKRLDSRACHLAVALACSKVNVCRNGTPLLYGWSTGMSTAAGSGVGSLSRDASLQDANGGQQLQGPGNRRAPGRG
jgi:hypothetical protein